MSTFVRGPPCRLRRQDLWLATIEHGRWDKVMEYYMGLERIQVFSEELGFHQELRNRERQTALAIMYMYGLDTEFAGIEHDDIFHLDMDLVQNDVLDFWFKIMESDEVKVKGHGLYGVLPSGSNGTGTGIIWMEGLGGGRDWISRCSLRR